MRKPLITAAAAIIGVASFGSLAVAAANSVSTQPGAAFVKRVDDSTARPEKRDHRVRLQTTTKKPKSGRKTTSTTVVSVPTTVADDNGVDNPATHDTNDDNGVDNPATHDTNDDNGVDNPATHDTNDDNGVDNPATHDTNDDNGVDNPATHDTNDDKGRGRGDHSNDG